MDEVGAHLHVDLAPCFLVPPLTKKRGDKDEKDMHGIGSVLFGIRRPGYDQPPKDLSWMKMPRPYMGIVAALSASALLVFPPLATAGVWNGAEEALEGRGLKFSLVYDGDGYANVAGGTRRGATYIGNLHLNLNVDAERLLGWTGANFFFYGLSIHGGHPSRFTGDAQGACNLEGPTEWKLEEAWVEQNLFSNQVSVLTGLYDLNTEFYHLQSSGLFLNRLITIKKKCIFMLRAFCCVPTRPSLSPVIVRGQ